MMISDATTTGDPDSKAETLRLLEMIQTTTVWFLGFTIASGPSAQVLASAVLLGGISVIPLLSPLTGPASHSPNVEAARRVALATAITGAVAVLLRFVSNEPTNFGVVAVGVACTWLILAISTRLKPLTYLVSQRPLAPASMWRTGMLAAHLKRVFDVVGSVVLILATSPVLVAAVIAIRLSDPGPALFRQRRAGLHDIPFEMYKFRSMVRNAEQMQSMLAAQSGRNGPLFKMADDPRITPVGKFLRELSIDELPQLFNVLRGEMSLVGPRPALLHEAKEFGPALSVRTNVKPGLTGLWQAEARTDPDFNRFIELDLRYLRERSPALDLWILLATVSEILAGIVAVPMRRAGTWVIGSDGIRPTIEIDLRDQPNLLDPATSFGTSSTHSVTSDPA